MFQVPEHHTLDRRGRGRNGTAAKQASDGPEYEATRAAKPVATAATAATPRQLGAKDGSMSLLMGAELTQFGDHLWSSQPGQENLSCIDADGALLACVIDPDDAVA